MPSLPKIKKRVLVPIFYRGHYGRLKPLLQAIRKNPKLELLIMTASQAAYRHFFSNIKHSEPKKWSEALPWYVRARLLSAAHRFGLVKVPERDHVIRKLREDGFSVDSCVHFFFDGGSPPTMAKSVGLGIMKIVDELRRLKPDLVVVNADRFEMMAVTIAAAYLNIPIAHNEAGDVSGTIDESVRHAITKFAHMHFTSTHESARRVRQMGENPTAVFTVGSPAIDAAAGVDLSVERMMGPIDLEKPFLLVLMHPVTTESREENELALSAVIESVERLALPTIIVGGNSDAQSDAVGKGFADWYDRVKPVNVFFAKHLHPDRFYRALAKASCALGNSSSFIREGAFFGTPAVMVGSRQGRRERGGNIREVSADPNIIVYAVRDCLKNGRSDPDQRFGDGKAAERMANILAETDPAIQKQFFDI